MRTTVVDIDQRCEELLSEETGTIDHVKVQSTKA
jgi:hypothetical protein